MTRFNRAIACLFLLALAGCTRTFETSYADPVAQETSRGWRLSDIVVAVPETLTVSEENSFAPEADIVWREDPPGDRRAQVRTIIETAAQRGAARLRSGRPVRLEIVMQQFHALSQRARTRLSSSGVHNITFTAQVVDPQSGAVLHGPEQIKADLVAFSGAEARAAEAAGQTQKRRITDHVSKVVAGWLGQGPDIRGSFSRRGR